MPLSTLDSDSSPSKCCHHILRHFLYLSVCPPRWGCPLLLGYPARGSWSQPATRWAHAEGEFDLAWLGSTTGAKNTNSLRDPHHSTTTLLGPAHRSALTWAVGFCLKVGVQTPLDWAGLGIQLSRILGRGRNHQAQLPKTQAPSLCPHFDMVPSVLRFVL